MTVQSLYITPPAPRLPSTCIVEETVDHIDDSNMFEFGLDLNLHPILEDEFEQFTILCNGLC
jgi:hypothetical protein